VTEGRVEAAIATGGRAEIGRAATIAKTVRQKSFNERLS
jgi:hypothetical protein